MEITKNNTEHENLTSKEGQTIKHSMEKNTKMRKQYELKPINREELRLQIIKDPNISHIADHFGVARSTIRRKIEKFGLEVVREVSEENHQKLQRVKEKKLKYCRLYMQFNGMKKIARDCHTSPLKVKEALIEYNIPILPCGKMTKIVQHILNKNFDIPISEKLTNMMISHLLGDGSLRIMKKGDLSYPDLDFGEYTPKADFLRSFLNMNNIEMTDELIQKWIYARQLVSDYPTSVFRFSQGVIAGWRTEDWVDYCSKMCNIEGYRNSPRYSKPIPNLFYYFDTNATVQVFDMYAKWYPNNKKTVPFDLEMNPDILLYWYIGDGTISYSAFYIATQSFSKKEVDFLCDLLFRTFGLICHTSKHRDGFILSISLKKDNLKRFFDYLDQADPDALVIAKRVYPWKFDKNLKKGDVLANRK